MAMPYQCIKRCGKVLVAARGSSIDTFNPENGYLLSTWNAFPTQDPNLALSEKAPNHLETQKSESSADTVTENSPPAKRRKLSAGEEDSPAAEPNQKNGMKKDGKGSKKGNRRSDAVASGLETPAVILLEATRDGRHVIAVTGEDKSIRVFQQDEGYLKQLSQRCVVITRKWESVANSKQNYAQKTLRNSHNRRRRNDNQRRQIRRRVLPPSTHLRNPGFPIETSNSNCRNNSKTFRPSSQHPNRSFPTKSQSAREPKEAPKSAEREDRAELRAYALTGSCVDANGSYVGGIRGEVLYLNC